MPYSVTETDVLNDALGQIGQGLITGIDDPSTNGRWCRTFYPTLRRSVLEMGNWHFAEWRVALGLIVGMPDFEYTYQFELPSDLLRIKEFNGNLIVNPNLASAVDPNWWRAWTSLYKIEGTRLLTNDSEAKIVYVRDIENPSMWSGLFYQAIVSMLAAKLYASIKHDPGKGAQMLQQAMGLWLPQAQAVSAQMQAVVPDHPTDLLWGRW